MKLAKLTVLLSLFYLSCGLHAAEPLTLENSFSAEELEWIKEKGKATITGKAYIRLEDGSYKGCDGFNMELLPTTAYSSERIQKTYGNTEQGQILISQNPPKFTPDPKAYHELSLKTTCGEGDTFVFQDVPQGEYYVMAFIFWRGSEESKSLEGGGVMKHLRVASDDVHEVVLKN
jgi:hypothetical protein